MRPNPELAILAETNPASGTDPDILAAAITRRYASAGVQAAQYQPFASIDELGHARPRRRPDALQFIRRSLCCRAGSHAKSGVVVGDPLGGRDLMTREDFGKNWRGAAIVIQRDKREK